MNTDTARAAILAQIRARQGRPAALHDIEAADAEVDIGRHVRGPQPTIADRIAGFTTQALALQTSVARVTSAQDVPPAVAAYLREQALGVQGVAWETLADLPWVDAGVTLEFRPPRDEDKLGITGCFCAVAETGSLVLASSPATPSSTHLLPQTHIAIVPASRIVATLEDAYALLRAELGELPRALSTVSGPSRTGDIEQTIVLGAHGPYRVHVVIVDAA
ncbi:MAG: lactate utilization protein C [Thiomonas sp.]|jgi:L-lactate dehydrogenase complex protein LldG|uniref:LutC/YkgG family protein n=1 Tax=Thiomonas TaxID=32012 RepID=UPI001ACF21EE|nr:MULTISPECIES: lactate utilization protein C [Thiomonas]MBN8776595.1 lactate utilization protein C [Thiomonas arsenitoxydans]MDE2268981.1 lactate utilization protein C [Betaproteobacteria bacterium]HML82095.1 lactate utilization protein C [Thiomonas arsenitoxydans]